MECVKMAISYGFFNSVNGDRLYNADDISNYFLKLISNGVFATPSNAMQVQASSGFTVSVSAGWGFINCKWLNNDTAYNLTLDAADIVLNRIDRVVMRLNPGNDLRNVELAIVKGTPAQTPTAPAPTRIQGGTWELSLAQIYVAAGSTEITQANITDERGNTSLCGYVTGLIDQIDTTNLFAQYDAAFSEWFSAVKETLATKTMILRYTNTFRTGAGSVSAVPIGISQYVDGVDVLNVYVNGLRLIPGSDYTINASAGMITLTQALDVAGTPVNFEVLKSIDGSDAESVLSIVSALQTEMLKIDANNYYCNGVNDNVTFPTWLAAWELTGASVANVIGAFGVDETTQTIDGAAYSFAYQFARAQEVTLNFAQCNAINARANNFAYFSGCKVEGMTVAFDDAANTAATAAITADSCTLENCDVYGSFTGTGAATAYSVTNCRLVECGADLTAVGSITGIYATQSTGDGCNVEVTTTGATAYGGRGNGTFANCSFIGIAASSGYGFYITGGNYSANGCKFRGYTADGTTGNGTGLSGENAPNVILTAIDCGSVAVTDYAQTASMEFADGNGVYTGFFYASPSVPATIVSYGAFTA